MTTLSDLQDRYDSMEPPEFYQNDFEDPSEEYDMRESEEGDDL